MQPKVFIPLFCPCEVSDVLEAAKAACNMPVSSIDAAAS